MEAAPRARHSVSTGTAADTSDRQTPEEAAGEAVNGDGSADDPFAQIDPTAVSIVVDQNIERPLGTGFYFLRPRYFVTAKHLVVDSKTGAARDNLVLMQRGPDYPRVSVACVHPSIDLAVLHVDQPVCSIPLYPSHERLTGRRGLRYWGYAPSKKDPNTNIFPVLVVDLPALPKLHPDHHERRPKHSDHGKCDHGDHHCGSVLVRLLV